MIGKRLGCVPCNRRRASEWQKNNKDRVNEKNRLIRERDPEGVRAVKRSSKISRYGITHEQYDEMLVSQNGVCLICKEPEVRRHRSGTVWSLSVDHDHETDEVRGLLCSFCNSGLANFRDNVEALSNAIAYLKGEL